MVVRGVNLPLETIRDVCVRYDVEMLSVFGSILREDFGPESDVDFLVVFKNDDSGPWMSKLTNLERELSEALGRRVDVVLQRSLKWVIRDRVLETAQVVYVAAQ